MITFGYLKDFLWNNDLGGNLLRINIMSLLENARTSIDLGLEDYKLAIEKDEKRFVSAIRNIYAGILLLFKQKLQRLSPSTDPDLLILRDIIIVRDKTKKKVTFKGEGRRTIDYFEIQKRFKSLGIRTDWKIMGEIRNIRNDLEHYFSPHSKNQARKIVSDTFFILKDFIRKELRQDPNVVLGQDNWAYIISQKNIHQAERKVWENTISRLHKQKRVVEALRSFTCPDCDMDLFTRRSDGIKCSVCGKRYSTNKYLELALKSAHGLSLRDYKHGAEETVCNCPECENETYHLIDDMCYSCSASGCMRCECGNRKLPEEDACDACAYMAHQMSKDD